MVFSDESLDDADAFDILFQISIHGIEFQHHLAETRMCLGIDEDQTGTQYRDGNHKDRSQGWIHHKDKIGTHSQVERCPDQHSYDTDISHTKHAHIGRHTHDHRRDRILFDVFKTVFLNLGKHCRTDIADKSCRSDRREQTGKCTENRTQNSQQDHVHTSSPDVLHVAAHTIDALIDDIRHDKRDQCIDHNFRYRKNRAQKGRPPTVFCIFSKQSEHTINIITFSSKYSLFDIKKADRFPADQPLIRLNLPRPGFLFPHFFLQRSSSRFDRKPEAPHSC